LKQVEQGFDFLGQNVRKYPHGKLLTKPSKKNIKTFLDRIRKTIKAAAAWPAAEWINEPNPKIRGWANYHRHVVSKRTFPRVDYDIFSSLWRWARRRHPNKNQRWIRKKYFAQRGTRNWIFAGEMYDDQGQPFHVRLLSASDTPIRRHVKVRSDANPYAPAYETYFEKRQGDHMRDTFQGSRFLRFLWYEQRGLCPVCNTKVTRLSGWRLTIASPE
jgi:RNA-directed DNA polymerase